MDTGLYNQGGVHHCLLCETLSLFGIHTMDGRAFYHYYDCKLCGKYSLAYEEVVSLQEHPLLKIYVRSKIKNNPDAMDDGTRITKNDVQLENLSLLPKDPLEAIDIILIWLSNRMESQDQKIKIDTSVDYILFYAKSSGELVFWLRTASHLTFIEWATEGFRISVEGWKRLNEIKSTKAKHSKFVFVAKYFDASLNALYDDGIRPAIIQTGYEPIYLNINSEPGNIDNKIIAGIRKSKFMIADYTGQRQSVYYEAGFASGLGIPVIDCIKEEEFDDLHFDKQHHAMIRWTSPEDLRQKLVDSIQANIL
jgi:hypothetical protein